MFTCRLMNWSAVVSLSDLKMHINFRWKWNNEWFFLPLKWDSVGVEFKEREEVVLVHQSFLLPLGSLENWKWPGWIVFQESLSLPSQADLQIFEVQHVDPGDVLSCLHNTLQGFLLQSNSLKYAVSYNQLCSNRDTHPNPLYSLEH